MCQSKENGGRRCDQATRYHTARASLQHKIRRQIREGKTDEAQTNTEHLNLLDQAQEKYGHNVFPMHIPLDAKTELLVKKLADAGLDPIIVGGSVRDVVSGSVPKDIDIEVYGDDIDNIVKTLRANGYHPDEVGKSFGVIKLGTRDGLDVDISVPRKDNLVGEGHRGFEVEMDSSLTVTEAASRRDFTMNAMGYSPIYKSAIDPYGGMEDFRNKQLKHVSDAFAEDPLRVLRGFQFSARYDMEMHPETIELSKKLLPRAKELSGERLVTEWEKFYTKGTHHAKALKVLQETGWDETVPHLKAYNNDITASRVTNAYSLIKRRKIDAEGRVRLLSASIASVMEDKHADSFMKATVNGKKEQKASYILSRNHNVSTDSDVRRLSRVFATSRTSFQDYLVVQKAQGKDVNVLEEKAKRLKVLDGERPALVMGKDILALTDRKPGPWMGHLTKEALDAQDDGVFSSKKDAMIWLKNKMKVQ